MSGTSARLEWFGVRRGCCDARNRCHTRAGGGHVDAEVRQVINRVPSKFALQKGMHAFSDHIPDFMDVRDVFDARGTQGFHFMNPETYDQVVCTPDVVGEAEPWLQTGEGVIAPSG